MSDTSGIFTGPSIVLQFTLNKNLAIGLWAFGMVYTLLRLGFLVLLCVQQSYS